MEVYIAFDCGPDYSSHSAFKSVHRTFDGAWTALDKDNKYPFRADGPNPTSWTGPDGFGRIEKVALKD